LEGKLRLSAAALCAIIHLHLPEAPSSHNHPPLTKQAAANGPVLKLFVPICRCTRVSDLSTGNNIHHSNTNTMRVTKPNTDLDFDFKVYADNRPCLEYTLPDRETDANAAECFIAVPEDATIRIEGTFSGSILHARVDVLADGSFVKGRMIDAPNYAKGLIKYHNNRKVDFKEFLHVPDPRTDPNRPLQKPPVVGGNLVLQQLPASTNSRFLDGDGETLGVGSLALVFSCNQVASKTYGKDGTPAYPDNTLGAWRHRRDEVHGVGISPEHECSVEPYNDSNPANAKKANTFWRDFSLARFGDKPIATMVFYYRTQAAIDAAGGVPLTWSVELAPYEGRSTSVAGADGHEGMPESSETDKLKPIKSLGIGKPLVLNGSSAVMGSSSRRPLVRHERAETEDSVDFATLLRNYDNAVTQQDVGRAAQPAFGKTAQPAGAHLGVDGNSVQIKEKDAEEAVSTVPARQSAPASHVPSHRRTAVSGMRNTLRPIVPESPRQNTSSSRPAPSTRPPAPSPASIAKAKLTQNQANPVQTSHSKLEVPAKPTLTTKSATAPAKRPATGSPASNGSPSPAPPSKRLRNEEFEAKKTALAAAAADRKARKEKVEAEKRERAEMQKKWEEEQAAKRLAVEEAKREAEEEEARRQAESEAEQRHLQEEEEAVAMEAELAALAQEGEDEDEEIAAMEAQAERERVEFEARTREGGS